MELKCSGCQMKECKVMAENSCMLKASPVNSVNVHVKQEVSSNIDDACDCAMTILDLGHPIKVEVEEEGIATAGNSGVIERWPESDDDDDDDDDDGDGGWVAMDVSEGGLSTPEEAGGGDGQSSHERENDDEVIDDAQHLSNKSEECADTEGDYGDSTDCKKLKLEDDSLCDNVQKVRDSSDSNLWKSAECRKDKSSRRRKRNVRSCAKSKTAVKLFTCKECGNLFTQQETLKRHMHSHTKEPTTKVTPRPRRRRGRKTKLNPTVNISKLNIQKLSQNEFRGNFESNGGNAGLCYEPTVANREEVDKTHRRHTGKKHDVTVKSKENEEPLDLCDRSSQHVTVKQEDVERRDVLVRDARIEVIGTRERIAPSIDPHKRLGKEDDQQQNVRCRNPGGKVNVCSECGRIFKQYSDLHKHKRIHSGEKPYACKYCDARFSRSFTLHCHERTHAGIKCHTCDTCGKSYSRRYDLNKHKMCKHTDERPYVCSECNKSFVTAHNLRVHERVHDGAMPFICEHCGHASNHRSDLRKHLRTHTGEKPYCCAICRKSFMQSGCLRSHEKKHHGL